MPHATKAPVNERQRALRAELDRQLETNEQLQRAAESDDATAEARSAWVAGMDRADVIAANIENEDRAAAQFSMYATTGEDGEARFEVAGEQPPAGSLGDHVVRSLSDALEGLRRGQDRFSLAADEIRAATPVVTNGLQDYDKGGVVQLPLMRPTVADLILQGSISGNGYRYLVEGPVTGGPDAVAEGGLKPELSGVFTEKTEALGKIAGWTKESDELIEDFPLLKSVVDGRLVTRLTLKEEQQLLNGSGTGANLLGLLNRSGIQTLAQGDDSVADAVFKATTKIQTATYLNADFVVIHPSDYETLRLSKDGNGQYFGGGFFTGPYGNGGVMAMPGLWGLRTVVTAAIAPKTILVGSSQASQLFRKGGVRVDVANQNEDDFIHDLVTVRAEVRELLAVYYPAANVKITLT